jgi:hypothetical protein
MKLLKLSNHLDKNLHVKDINLGWIIQLYPLRHSNITVGPPEYPTFCMTRREQIKFCIRLYKQSIKH